MGVTNNGSVCVRQQVRTRYAIGTHLLNIGSVPVVTPLYTGVAEGFICYTFRI